jgi:hypothetical protein
VEISRIETFERPTLVLHHAPMHPHDDPRSLERAYAAVVADARAAIAAGREPDADALRSRIRAAGGPAAAERTALQQLERVLAVGRARALVARQPAAAPPPPAPPRRPRALLRSRPTISGNIEVRRDGPAEAAALEWDTAPAVAHWEVRVSERPDPRGDYVVRETLTVSPSATRVELPLGDAPLRVHVLGRSRDGRLVRRALISALTRETWDDRWQRRASAA